MNVFYRLSSIVSVLDRESKRSSFEKAFESLGNFLCRLKYIVDFIHRQVVESFNLPFSDHKNMSFLFCCQLLFQACEIKEANLLQPNWFHFFKKRKLRGAWIFSKKRITYWHNVHNSDAFGWSKEDLRRQKKKTCFEILCVETSLWIITLTGVNHYLSKH